MINEMIGIIVSALLQEFGEDSLVDTEAVRQGLEKPHFAVSCIDPNRIHALKTRYRSNLQFCVYYFASHDLEWMKECNEVIERMMSCLEKIGSSTGNAFRGTDMTAHTEDGVVTFLVAYTGFFLKSGQQTDMSELRSEIKVKG